MQHASAAMFFFQVHEPTHLPLTNPLRRKVVLQSTRFGNGFARIALEVRAFEALIVGSEASIYARDFGAGAGPHEGRSFVIVCLVARTPDDILRSRSSKEVLHDLDRRRGRGRGVRLCFGHG